MVVLNPCKVFSAILLHYSRGKVKALPVCQLLCVVIENVNFAHRIQISTPWFYFYSNDFKLCAQCTSQLFSNLIYLSKSYFIFVIKIHFNTSFTPHALSSFSEIETREFITRYPAMFMVNKHTGSCRLFCCSFYFYSRSSDHFY